MVYESDFYTTRRPYSSSYTSPRPYVSSYNVSPLGLVTLQGPYYMPVTSNWYFVRTHMPYVAHKRIVKIIHSPIRIYHSPYGGTTASYLPYRLHCSVRPSVIAAELNRIRYLQRPSTISYTERYLNSRDFIDFDDEAKDIRAQTDSLLKRIHVFVPRPSPSEYTEISEPERFRSDDYVRRIINAKNARKEIEALPWYTTPEKRDIHDGHLACVKYIGGRPVAKRRPYYTVNDLRPGDVKAEVNLLSFYLKNRRAAEAALKKKPDDETIKRVEEYLQKKAMEKKMEEERKAWEAAERKRIAEEKEIERLALLRIEEEKRMAEIREQEKLEEERRLIEKRAELARKEAERLENDQQMLNEAIQQAIADELERVAQEEAEARKRLEDEEKFEAGVPSESAADDDVVGDEFTDEHTAAHDLSDQEKEALPYKVDEDEVTQIDEEPHEEENSHVINPFSSDHQGSSAPQDTEPVQDSEAVVQENNTNNNNHHHQGGEQASDDSVFGGQPDAEIQESSESWAVHGKESESNEAEQPAVGQELGDDEVCSTGDADQAIADDEVHIDEVQSQTTSVHEDEERDGQMIEEEQEATADVDDNATRNCDDEEENAEEQTQDQEHDHQIEENQGGENEQVDEE